MSEALLKAAISKNTEEFAKIFRQEFLAGMKMKKEAPTMQVIYNGFTGKLLKMEHVCENYYDITIYDAEKEARVSFSGVKLEDVKFLGGVVAFGG